MKKIRINVLARELEVKSHLILELLPELGVSEKVTHSSSIDEDVADKLRVRFGLEPVGSGERTPEHESGNGGHSHGVALEEPPGAHSEAEMRGPAKPAPSSRRWRYRRPMSPSRRRRVSRWKRGKVKQRA